MVDLSVHSTVIKALLWKNIRMRLVNKLMLIIELIFSLLGGILLYLFLQADDAFFNDTCNYKAKAMPTAGGMLFLQTLLCAANNTCESKALSSFDSFKSSVLATLGEELKGKYNIKSINRRNIDSENLVKDLYTIESLIEAVDKENEKQRLLYNSLLRSDIYSATSKQETQNMEKLSRMKKNIYTSSILRSLFHAVTGEPDFSIAKRTVLDSFFCGPDMKEIAQQLLNAVKNEMDVHSIIRIDKSDKETNEFCKEIINALDNSKFQSVMKIFKPLLLGKVVYAPDAPVINKMMNRINDSFVKIKEALNSAEVVTRAWSDMRTWDLDEFFGKYKLQKEFLKEAVKSKMVRAVLQNFGDKKFDNSHEDNLERQVNKFQKLLNETEKNFIKYLQQTDQNLVFNIVSLLECLEYDKVVAASDEGSGLSKSRSLSSKQKLWGFVTFTNVPAGAEELPSSVTYKLRVTAERAPDTNYKKGTLNITGSKSNPIAFHKEILGGTAYLQNMIEGELIRELTGKEDVPGIYLKQLSYPCHKIYEARSLSADLFKMFFLFGWIIFFCRNVKRIVLEKEILFRELLRVFGASLFDHWVAFYIEALIFGVICCLLSSIVYSLSFDNFFIIFCFEVAYVLAIISLSLLVSTFFQKATYCLILSSAVYFSQFLLFQFAESFNSPLGQIFGCLFSILAGGFGSLWIANMNIVKEPPGFLNLNYSPDPGSYITMMAVILILLLDSVLYVLLAIYFENVLTTSSFRKPFYFCFLPSYWMNCFNKNEAVVEESSQPEPPQRKKKNANDSNNFEKEPEGAKAGIEIINVSKEFGKGANKVRAVNDLTLTFYENQITAFLGHNGAGKTTTVSMMTGVISITKGTIRIYGVDLRRNPTKALNSVGLCMQENILLNSFTVQDHLQLIGKLKGLSKQEINKNVNELLQLFEMSSRARQNVQQLSGGWKRKVCVAMAFMGGSRIIILDEPTAGIDPFARRIIWDVLVKLKQNRTIILITHHLDEADLLGDRIAIIASGELKCYGSSSFLKAQCNKSYILTVDTNTRPEKPSKKSKSKKKNLSLQAQEILSVVKAAIGGSEFEEERGNEILFSLPPRQSASDLIRLFDYLDRNRKRLDINAYGISAVSLEEVFLKVLEKAETADLTTKGSTISISSSRKSSKFDSNKSVSPQGSKEMQQKSTTTANEWNVQELEKEEIKSESLEKSFTSEIESTDEETRKIIAMRHKEKFRAGRKFWNHFVAILILRFIHLRRNYIFLLVQIFGAIIFIIVIFLLRLISTATPSLTIDISQYESSVLFYSNDLPTNPTLLSYEEALLGPYGLGIKCVSSPGQCSLESIPRGSLIGDSEAVGECSCNETELKCTNENEELPSAVMSSGHRLFNLTGLDLETWLIATEHIYKLNRIGGITFGHFAPLAGLSTGDFVDLFSGKKLFEALNKYISMDSDKIDPKEFSSAIMGGINDTCGQEIFKNKDASNNIIIWFNSGDKIASMALLNGVSNLVLRASLPSGTDPSSYSIKLILDPLKATTETKKGSNGKSLVFLLILITSFVFALYVIYLVNESSSGMKHLQIICGITPIIYWFVTFLWDILVFTAFLCCLLLVLVIFGVTEICGKYPLPAFLAGYYAYAVTTLLFVYLISLMFNRSSNAFLFLVIWLGTAGIFCVILDAIAKEKFNAKTHDVIRKILLVVPEFSLYNLFLNVITEGMLDTDVLEAIQLDFFEWDLTTLYIVRILCNGGAYLVILLLWEYRFIQPFGLVTRALSGLTGCCGVKSKHTDDDNVAQEKQRVLSGRAKEEGDIFIMKNLTKVYCGQMHPAVNHVSVGVKQGECLGLLGMNGAGKTTIFKMITGYITPTFGDATIAGLSMTYRPIQSRLLIGYCPQLTALDPYLTPAEHLSFFCQIRGFSRKRKQKEVNSMIDLMNLGNYKNRISKTLSGGNQRKLNAAIALLCEPELICLDEPTAGMDVLARRFLWSRIIQARQDGRCVILTTHSMEECQALATQVSIMFKGGFACFGSSQHLKNKFNDGYKIVVRLVSPDKAQEFSRFLSENLSGAEIVKSHNIQLTIKIPPDTSLGRAVSAMGEAKRKPLIEDFSVTQTSLESVFLKIIGDVDREEAFKKGGPCKC